MMTDFLQTDFLKKIPWLQIFNKTFDQPELLPIELESYHLNFEVLKSMAKESFCNNEAYGRQVLFKDAHIEVMLASWRLKSLAEPHNHGASQGLIWFIEGDFYEQHFQFENKHLITLDKPIFFKSGSVAKVHSNDIHSCGPANKGMSLHIYVPPIHKMKVWDRKAQRTLTVADYCGAWIPSDTSLITEEVLWNKS